MQYIVDEGQLLTLDWKKSLKKIRGMFIDKKQAQQKPKMKKYNTTKEKGKKKKKK